MPGKALPQYSEEQRSRAYVAFLARLARDPAPDCHQCPALDDSSAEDWGVWKCAMVRGIEGPSDLYENEDGDLICPDWCPRKLWAE